MGKDTTPEDIRKRPGMFIGDTRDGSGLTHMVWEVLANAVDQHLGGACNCIRVLIEEDGAVPVEDDGSGFPLQLIDGVSFAERALTSFHTTPTLDGHAPHTHVGLHGVGIFVVCALSSHLELRVDRQGTRFRQRFARGVATSRLEEVGPTDGRGTRVTFLSDSTIFTGPGLDSSVLLERFTELSFLLPKLTIRFTDRRQRAHEQREHVLHQPAGAAGYLAERATDAAIGALFSLTELVEDVSIEVAARWSVSTVTSIQSFANTERTTSGGTHVHGLRAGLSAGLKKAAPGLCDEHPAEARGLAVTRNLEAIVCVRLHDPTYDSPTKSRLSTARVQRVVRAVVARAFATFLKREPSLLAHFEALLREGRTPRETAARS